MTAEPPIDRLFLQDAVARLEASSIRTPHRSLLELLRAGRIIGWSERFIVCRLGSNGELTELSRSNDVALPRSFWIEAMLHLDKRYVSQGGSSGVDLRCSTAFYTAPTLEGHPPLADEGRYGRFANSIYLDATAFEEFFFAVRGEPIRLIKSSNPAYISPFMALMFEAIEHFGLPDNVTLKKHLVEWFSGRQLPGGGTVSPNQAEYLATFCRDPEAMKGGNKRMG